MQVSFKKLANSKVIYDRVNVRLSGPPDALPGSERVNCSGLQMFSK